MTNINWDSAPEGAVAVGQRFGELAFINAAGLAYNAGLAYIGGDWADSSGWNIIGKRPQLERKTVEDAAAAKSKPEWTHTWSGDRCRVLFDEPDIHGYMCILREKFGYDVVDHKNLKPIKPTISKSEAESIFDFADSIGQLQVAEQWVDNNYTITD